MTSIPYPFNKNDRNVDFPFTPDPDLEDLRRKLRDAEQRAEKRRITKRIRDLDGGLWL